MKETIDNFSKHACDYARYRPVYPEQLYNFLFSLVEDKRAAWDCATGNGQVAVELSKVFDKVYATDISDEQLKNAIKKDNIFYSVERAEKSSLKENSVGLVAVAQAIHWFDFDNFYTEVKRVITPRGVLAVIGYGLLKVNDEVDKLVQDFHNNIMGPYWDKERKYIDDEYKTIPFPFEEIESPKMYKTYDWTLEELIGYFNTWSSVKHYEEDRKENPVILIKKELEKLWPKDAKLKVHFPVLLRVAKIVKED
ncbi:MAG: class I SAM-dependent methyltransferase [Ferruginibacter sp.]